LLISGDIEFLAATDSVLAFRRFDAQGALLAAFNLSPDAAQLALPKLNVARAITATGFPRAVMRAVTWSCRVTVWLFFNLQRVDLTQAESLFRRQ
jgi:hypothetical protein